MKNLLFIISLLVITILLLILLSYKLNNSVDSNNEYKEGFLNNHKTFSVEIPEQISFADEPVPLQRFDVREKLDKELLINVYWQSNTLLMFKRAYRWFPIIDKILKENKIPSDFKYLALVESDLTNKISPAGAEGYWQFIKETGIKYGLEINNDIDERYSMEKATESACRYFHEAYDKYKNWTLVAASFNRGISGIDKQLDKQRFKINNQGNINNNHSSIFFDIYLNDETTRYIYRILAIKAIFNKPSNYGFYLRMKDLYPPIPTHLISVDTSITNLNDFAARIKINYKILKDFNPWIKGFSFNNNNKTKYYFKIPNDVTLNYDILYNPLKDQNKILTDSVNFGN
jgi:membrane-bound lytic murein transglycosylase D